MAKNKRIFHFYPTEREEKRKARIFFLLSIVLIIFLFKFGFSTLSQIADFFANVKNPTANPSVNDSIPPSPPRFNTLPEETKETSINIDGFAESSSKILLYKNGFQDSETQTSLDGNFKFENIGLDKGKNEFYAIAEDNAKNQSQASKKVFVFFDNTAPKLEISKPTDGSSFSGSDKRTLQISGQTEEGVTITVNDRMAIIEQNFSFNSTYELVDGENNIKIVAQDRAGNITEKELKVTFSN